MYNFEEHGPSFVYSRRPLTGAPFSPHMPGVPPMTELQAEALDIVHFTAEKHQLCIKLERGDIQIFNNLAMFHARKGFVDDGSQKRHFLRLWLKNERLAWKRPEALMAQAAELYEKSSFRGNAKWDINKAPTVPRVITRHMACS
jgi:Taurine catabolism dioxygenase TauD, TfdA family